MSLNEKKDIKIVMALSPINFLNGDYSILKYGDDFFFGYVNETSTKETEINNKRGYRFSNFNISNDKHLIILRKINFLKKKLDKKINLVLNNIGLLDELDEKKIKNEITLILKQIEIDRFIVTDFFLLDFLERNFPEIGINLSSLAMFSNIYHFNLLRQFKNIKRIILHRDIDEDTIISLINYLDKNNLQIELEYFAMNEWCYNIDGLCYSLHNVDEKIPFLCQRNGLYNNNIIRKYMIERSNCQLCLLHYLNNNSLEKNNIFKYIQYYKIPGRGHNNKILKAYAKITKKIIGELLSKNKIGFENKKEIFKKESEGIINDTYINTMFCGNCYFKNI